VGCPSPKEFHPSEIVLQRARQFAAGSGGRVDVVHDPRAAVAGARAVYTDTWTGYQIPPEHRAERERILTPFRVTSTLMRDATPDAVFMHSLPAWRGQELDAEVIDGPRSIVFSQVENRLHTEKAILLTLLH